MSPLEIIINGAVTPGTKEDKKRIILLPDTNGSVRKVLEIEDQALGGLGRLKSARTGKTLQEVPYTGFGEERVLKPIQPSRGSKKRYNITVKGT